jgi:excisionase family DNA binding protein
MNDQMDRFLTTRELAAFLSVPEKTIRLWHASGSGPCAIKVGRHLRFRRRDIEAWIEDRKSRPPARPT